MTRNSYYCDFHIQTWMNERCLEAPLAMDRGPLRRHPGNQHFDGRYYFTQAPSGAWEQNSGVADPSPYPVRDGIAQSLALASPRAVEPRPRR